MERFGRWGGDPMSSCSCLDPTPSCCNPPSLPFPSLSSPLPLSIPFSCWELPSCPSLQLGHLRRMRGCATETKCWRLHFRMFQNSMDMWMELLGSCPVASDINLRVCRRAVWCFRVVCCKHNVDTVHCRSVDGEKMLKVHLRQHCC